MSGISDHEVVTIAVHENFGVYAYDVSDGSPRMLLGVDIQPGEDREAAVDNVLSTVRALVLKQLDAKDGDNR